MKPSNLNFNKMVVWKPIDVGGFDGALEFRKEFGNVFQNGVS